MECLQGAIDRLDHEQRIVGRARDGRPPATVHVYRFRVDGRAVELRHGAPLPMNCGDEVQVVCAGRGRPARVYAWANRTWGATLVEPAGAAAAMRGWLPLVPALPALAGVAGLWPPVGGAAIAGVVVLGLVGGAGLGLSMRGFIEYRRYRDAAARLQA